MTEQLIAPHGSSLVQLLATPERQQQLKKQSLHWPSWTLTPRQLCDLEMLITGGFSPLKGFMGQADYESCVRYMRLENGLLWPIPITLDMEDAAAEDLHPGQAVALRDPEGMLLAVLHVEDLWRPDRLEEADLVYGTIHDDHPAVDHLLHRTHDWYVGGRVEGVQLPHHYDFRHLRLAPADTRAYFSAHGWDRVVAFQTRNPMHRAHKELTLRAMRENDAHLLIHPVVGMTKNGDVDHYTRVRCYEALMPYYPEDAASLALLPLAMRMGGPREAVWHALIRKNFGCTHFIVGREHACPGTLSNGDQPYHPYAAQELLTELKDELGIQIVPFRSMAYVPDMDTYLPEESVPKGMSTKSLSGTALRQKLLDGLPIPEWFTFPEVTQQLRKTFPPRPQQGLTLFFTGLSGAGKSTLANGVMVKLMELGDRPVTLLDGDIVRTHLSSELGFSKEDRRLNVLRIGFVASEITKNRGIALCAPIAPYQDMRDEVREMIRPQGAFILIYVATPLEVCEDRDRKGLYARARAGLLDHFTGISDPYEPPKDAEIVIDTTTMTPEEGVDTILAYLMTEGYLEG